MGQTRNVDNNEMRILMVVVIVDGWVKGWMDGVDGMSGWMDGWIDRMDGWDGGTSGWTGLMYG